MLQHHDGETSHGVNDHDPKIRDAELAEVVVEAREFCLRLEDETRGVVQRP